MSPADNPRLEENPGFGTGDPDLVTTLRVREAQLNAIIAASPVPKFVINNDHRVISWNRALENMTGIKASAVLGTNHHWRAFHSEVRPCLADLIVDGSTGTIPVLYPHSYQRADLVPGAYEVTDFFPSLGSRGKWLHRIAAPLIGDNGAVIGAVETLEDITTFIGIQNELRESEERYSALFSNSASVSLLIDPDTGRIVNANDAAVNYYGYPRERLLSMGISDLNRLPREKVVRDLVRAKDQEARHFQSVHYRADGKKRYVEIYSGPITVQGKPLFYSIIHDITDRKTAEAGLEKSQYLLSEAMEMAQMADWEFEVDTATFIFNDRFYALYATTAKREGGYRMPAEVYMREFTHPDDQPVVADEIAKALSRPGSGYYSLREHRIIRRDGQVRYILVRIRVTKNARGLTIGTHGANQDITDRKLSENALRESEERYRTLIEQLPDYVIVHREGILLYINPAGAATLSHDATAFIGKSFFNLVAPESHDIVRQAVMRRMKGEDVPPYEIRIAARNGSYHTVLVHGALIQYDGAPASINVLTDITPLKEAEEAIRHANEDLEKRVLERTEDLRQANVQLTAEVASRAQAEQEISRSLEEKVLLLREIHHRVKNNLQIITSLLKLQSRFITDPQVLEAIRDTESRVRTMSLVHERIYRSPDIAEINLKDYLLFLVKQVAQFYNVPQHRISLSVTMPAIMADVDLVTPLGLIMNELASNSLKHAFPDNRKGSISIDGTPQGEDRLRFVYHDTGIGMPEGFDWKTPESLGLRLVNSLVDQLDGTIERGGGEGTSFIIEIRRKKAGKAVEGNLPGHGIYQEYLPDKEGNNGA
jgi:PAS domain S-box-containing protein